MGRGEGAVASVVGSLLCCKLLFISRRIWAKRKINTCRITLLEPGLKPLLILTIFNQNLIIRKPSLYCVKIPSCSVTSLKLESLDFHVKTTPPLTLFSRKNTHLVFDRLKSIPITQRSTLYREKLRIIASQCA